MNQEFLDEIKNKLYESEGLIELIALRPEKTREFLSLLEGKIKDTLSMIGDLNSSIPNKESSVPEHLAESKVSSGNIEYDDALDDEPLYEMPEDDDLNPESDTYEIGEEEMTEVNTAPSEEESPKSTRDNVRNPAFCLNDRFRFRRALFNGSDKEFNSVMDHIATLSAYEEAEDYFYGERGLEPEDEDVADFMEIIRNYFER